MIRKSTKNNLGFTRTPTSASLPVFLSNYYNKTIYIFRNNFLRTKLRGNKNTMPKLVCGFTLVETLVAISILSLSIVATFTAVQNGLQTSNLAKDQITAFYLAQEAMEYIKNIRDQNALKTIVNGTTTNWLSGLATPGDPCDMAAGKTCTIDSPHIPPSLAVVSCDGGFGTCPVINQDSVSSLFGYNAGWTPTYFKREVQFASVPNTLPNVEVAVTIRISWTNHGRAQSFQVKESLFDRQ